MKNKIKVDTNLSSYPLTRVAPAFAGVSGPPVSLCYSNLWITYTHNKPLT